MFRSLVIVTSCSSMLNHKELAKDHLVWQGSLK